MDYGVDIVLAEATDDIVSGSNVTLMKREIWAGAQDFSIFQGGAVLELVERDKTVKFWIGDCEGSKDPRTSAGFSSVLDTSLAQKDHHVVKWMDDRDPCIDIRKLTRSRCLQSP